MIRNERVGRFDNTYYGLTTEFYKGGGGYVPPPQPTPAEQAEARISEMRAQEQMALEREAREQKRLEEQKAQRRANNQSKFSVAKQNALDYGRSQLAGRTLDPADIAAILSDYEGSVNRSANNFNEDAETFVDPFDPSNFTTAYEKARGNRRSALTQQVRGFAGAGFEDEAFGDNSDDAIIDAILAEQQADTQANIDRAWARGTINDAGKTYAANELSKQAKRGRATANSLGMGVLSNYRSGLRSAADRLNERVSNYDLGDDFNLEAEQGRINSLRDRYKGSLEGDILNAIGDQQFFDSDTILGKAGQRSGVSNGSSLSATAPTAANTNLLNAFGQRTEGNTADTKTGNQVF